MSPETKLAPRGQRTLRPAGVERVKALFNQRIAYFPESTRGQYVEAAIERLFTKRTPLAEGIATTYFEVAAKAGLGLNAFRAASRALGSAAAFGVASAVLGPAAAFGVASAALGPAAAFGVAIRALGSDAAFRAASDALGSADAAFGAASDALGSAAAFRAASAALGSADAAERLRKKIIAEEALEDKIRTLLGNKKLGRAVQAARDLQ